MSTESVQLRVGIDGYNLAIPNGTGVTTYGFMLAKTLGAMGHSVHGVFGVDVGRDLRLREVRFYESLVRTDPGPWDGRPVLRSIDALRLIADAWALEIPRGQVEIENFVERLPSFDRVVSFPHLFSRAHAYFRLTGRMAKLRMSDPPDIMHWTYPVPVKVEGSRNIYTIHDIVPLRLPYASLGRKQGYRNILEACIRESELICTVSESSRRDIISYFSVDPERVFNTYQISSIDDQVLAQSPLEAAEEIEAIFGLPHRGYFLFFGAIEPKKNLGRLIEAYLSLGSKTPLVIVAGRSWQSESELRLLPRDEEASDPRHAHLADRIIRIEYLPRRLLMRLARGARAVVFPSLYEGFGLPAHEAMLLGAPVLSSNTGAIPEIAGDAAVLVDPYDVKAIADGIRRLDEDEALRSELSARGPVQACLFSAQSYKARLSTMYRLLVETA